MTIQTTDIDRNELQDCRLCKRGMMHRGDITFYEFAASQCLVDLKSVQQQHGLEVMLGAAAPLAAVFAPSTRAAVRLPAVRSFICSECMSKTIMPYEFVTEE